MKKPLPMTDLAAIGNAPILLPGKPEMPALPRSNPITATAPALPTDARPNLSVEERESFEQVKQQADLLRDFSCGCYLTSILGGIFGKQVGPAGIQYYRDQLLRDAGNPADPIERLLIEQLALAHHSIAKLYRKAATAQTPEEVEIYNIAAARLLGEFRRTVLCYREFRSPLTPKKITLVAQQNLAAGDQQVQQVAYVNGGADSLPLAENSPEIEISHKSEEYDHV